MSVSLSQFKYLVKSSIEVFGFLVSQKIVMRKGWKVDRLTSRLARLGVRSDGRGDDGGHEGQEDGELGELHFACLGRFEV